jgi:HTH-type transcriptional regulator, sugar sensing transcriptional regulator
MEMIPELKELNLNDNEVRVYLATLSLGSSKVSEIAKRSELIRTTTYAILNSLIEKGLVSIVLKNNVTFFQATNPKKLTSILDEKKRKINSILPKLEHIKEAINNPHKVELFEGREGLKTVFNDLVIKLNETIKIIGFSGKFIKFSESYSDIYYRKKKENKIKSLVITGESDRESSKNNKIINSEFRYLPSLDADSEIFIYNGKIAFVSLKEDNLTGVIVEDREMFKLQSIIFDNLWKLAKK